MLFKIRSRAPVPGTVTNALICEAIKDSRIIQCVYGDGIKRRIEPHCHGHSHAGHEILSAYQIEGGEEGWKMFDVQKITDVEVTSDRFTPRNDFNPENPGVTQPHCKI